MSPFNFSRLLQLFYVILIIISEIAADESFDYDLILSPRNNSRSRLHTHLPSESRTKRPKKIHNREGGSRFLTRRNQKARKKKLDKSSFLGLMGDDFKEPWMTYKEPKKPIISIPPDEIRNLTAIKGSWATTELESELARLNLTADLTKFAPELLPHEALVRQYLLKRTSCPVEFTWKDLGNKYWPRWVRQGECINRGGVCSFPPGMICVPGVSTVVHLLHWQCSKRMDRTSRSAINYDDGYYIEYKRPVAAKPKPNGKARKIDVFKPPKMETSVLYKKRVPPLPSAIHLPRKTRRCEWKKVPYLITIDCFCAC
ncbi:uncharacterized protein LOC129984648 [Argiope bruennichi]|uniref:uncharacterized protein LOC129984648 n=1 Tax=Argiope bruennichi TaxID=94029 RepID=UPI00249409CF|nr:uncharacterized protein LOC129984648 [Argiope bruennichi]